MGGDGAVDSVFGKNGGVVVGEGDAAAAGAGGSSGHFIRGSPVAQPVVFSRFGDVPVLAEAAAQVTAGGAEGENARAGIEMVEGFFLDGVNAKAGSTAVTGQHHPLFPRLAYKTETALARAQFTEAGAKVALDTAVVQLMPPLPSNDSRFNHCPVRSSHDYYQFIIKRQESGPGFITYSQCGGYGRYVFCLQGRL
jgi:hypothetical protein